MPELTFRWVFVLVLLIVFGYIIWRVRVDRGRLTLQVPLGFLGVGILLLVAGAAIGLAFGLSPQDALFLKAQPAPYAVVSGYALMLAGALGCVGCLVGWLFKKISTR
jgi:hypothetical protein